jgi:RNA polymerase sigma factor (sigma-70 family)
LRGSCSTRAKPRSWRRKRSCASGSNGRNFTRERNFARGCFLALNLARNRLRWWRRRPTVELQEWSERGEQGPEAGGMKSEQTAGADALERDERAAAVREAIAALPTELREAIVLFEYEQMSQIEIAAVVGATPKAVETRIYRAREKLRGALKRWV